MLLLLSLALATQVSYVSEVGEVVILANQDFKSEKGAIEKFMNDLPVGLAKDPQLVKSSNKDIDQLKAKGLWFVIARGTRARVITPDDGHGDPDGRASEVEVLGGPHKGIKGWVHRHQIQANTARDTSYAPQVGDEAVLYDEEVDEKTGVNETIPIFATHSAFEGWERALDAKDKEGLRELYAAEKYRYIPSGTKLRVLRFHEGRDTIRDAWEVRILSGQFKGVAVYVLASDVAQLKAVKVKLRTPEDLAKEKAKEAEVARAKEAAARAKEAAAKVEREKDHMRQAEQRRAEGIRADAAQAASLMKIAEGFEKKGQPRSALSLYREVVRKYPMAEHIGKARERIEALSPAK